LDQFPLHNEKNPSYLVHLLKQSTIPLKRFLSSGLSS